MEKKIIIFDLDGVLVDSSGLVNEFTKYTFPSMSQDMMNEILCGNFHEGMERFKKNNKPREETPEEYKVRSEKYSSDKAKSPLFDGIRELLEKLHSLGYILTINTSATRVNCEPLLKYSKIDKFFDYVATKEVAISKVEKFNIILEKYSVSKDETIFVTDTLGDLMESKSAGIPTIAVTYGAHDRSFFMRESHSNLVSIVDSVEELGRMIV